MDHSPLPWQVGRCKEPTIFDKCSDVMIAVLDMGDKASFEQGFTNAAFIVRAVNVHDLLVAAAKEALRELKLNAEHLDGVVLMSCQETQKDLIAAITKAEGCE